MTTTQCAAGTADWVVTGTVGLNHCPETKAGRTCTKRLEHEQTYKTERVEYSAYFRGDKPEPRDVRARLARGWYIVHITTRRYEGN